MPPRKLLGIVGVMMGSLGLVACAAGLVFLWMAGQRLGRVAEAMFAKVDGTLTVVDNWVGQTQKQVAAARITSDDVLKMLRDWAEREASERLVVKLNVAEKTERVATGLQNADEWLEFSDASVSLAQQMLALITSAGVSTETTWLDRIGEQIAALRVQLSEARQFVNNLHERAGELSADKSAEEILERVVPLALRLVATLGALDARFEKFDARISAARAELTESNAKTQRLILIVSLVVALLILWIAAGQAALFYLGWRRNRESPTAPSS